MTQRDCTKGGFAPVVSTRRSLARSALIVATLTLAAMTCQAAQMDRQLEIHIAVSGNQSWHRGDQFSNATTTQQYDLSTRLRSDGRLYSGNLLDPDQQRRLAVKQEYLTRAGLERLKRENGGKLPSSPAELAKLSNIGAADRQNCADDIRCNTELAERYAAITALQNNSVADLEAFLASTATDGPGRYLYFFGYDGCPNSIHITNKTHIAGTRSFQRNGENPVPFTIDRQADSRGSAAEQRALCDRYTATIDTKTDTMYLENAFIPSPHGTSVRVIDGHSDSQQLDLPVPAEVLAWTNAKLQHAQPSGSDTAKLQPTTPLDGDATIMGRFDGTLKVSMQWSFQTPAPAGTATTK